MNINSIRPPIPTQNYKTSKNMPFWSPNKKVVPLHSHRDSSSPSQLQQDKDIIIPSSTEFRYPDPDMLREIEREHQYNASDTAFRTGMPPIFNKNHTSDKINGPSERQRIAFFLDSSYIGRYWELFDAFLTIIFVSLYVYNTAFPKGDLPILNQYLDFTTSILLFIQYIPQIYFSMDPWSKLLSSFSFLTFLSCIPVWITTMMQDDPWFDNTYMGAAWLVYFYPCRFMRLHLSIMNIVTPSKNILFSVSDISQQAIKIGFSIFSTLLTVSGWVHIVEYKLQDQKDFTFADVFYFITVSSTSGLTTQIVPDNAFSRLVILYVMIVGAIFIPTNLSKLLALMGKKSKFDKPYYKSGEQMEHVVIIIHYIHIYHIISFFLNLIPKYVF